MSRLGKRIAELELEKSDYKDDINTILTMNMVKSEKQLKKEKEVIELKKLQSIKDEIARISIAIYEIKQLQKEIHKLNLAEFMHNKYEEIAKEEGWKTQRKTRVKFEDLPEENKRTMNRLAEEIKKKIAGEQK